MELEEDEAPDAEGKATLNRILVTLAWSQHPHYL